MKIILITLIFLLIDITLFAQPGPGPLTGPPTPIDGGMSILLGSGIILGIKRYRNKNKD